jgi:hypothetical protein
MLVSWETKRLSRGLKKKESSQIGLGPECLRTHGCVRRAETHGEARVCTPMGAQRDGEPSTMGTGLLHPTGEMMSLAHPFVRDIFHFHTMGTPPVAPPASYGRQPG